MIDVKKIGERIQQVEKNLLDPSVPAAEIAQEYADIFEVLTNEGQLLGTYAGEIERQLNVLDNLGNRLKQTEKKLHKLIRGDNHGI